MKCPECGRTAPDMAARCPDCQAPLEGVFTGTMPPRASQRDAATRASLGFQSVLQSLTRLFRSGPAVDLGLTNLLERLFASPELWLSLLMPGAGHYYLGRVLPGYLIFGAAAAFFAFIAVLSRDEFADITYPMMFAGIFLGSVHMHAWTIGANLRNHVVRCIPRAMAVPLILAVLVGQFYLLSWLLHGPGGSLGNNVIIRGANLWGPVLVPGDRLIIHPLPAADILPGDLVMISNTVCERVLGVSSDTVELVDGRITRNKVPLVGTWSMPLSAWNTRYVPDQAYRTDANPNERIVVPEGHVAYLWWGRKLKTAAVAEIRGRIDGIAAPPDRRCRFDNGRPVPLDRSWLPFRW